MPNVIQIVKAHLEREGFDGLVHVDSECGCLCDDLAPCCSSISDCEPGYRGADEDGEPGDWAIYRTKERARESVETVRARAAAQGGEHV